MECGIYGIYDKELLVYVGQSCNINKRKRYHYWQLKKKIHPNTYLQNIYNKRPEIDFRVIELVKSRQELTQREIYYINLLRPTCNVVLPGVGDSWIFTEERNKKVSMSNKGKPKTAEHRKNISISKMGNKNPLYGKTPWNKGIINWNTGSKNHFYGKKHSVETKMLISKNTRKSVDLDQLKLLISEGESLENIAYYFNVSQETIRRRRKEYLI